MMGAALGHGSRPDGACGGRWHLALLMVDHFAEAGSKALGSHALLKGRTG